MLPRHVADARAMRCPAPKVTTDDVLAMLKTKGIVVAFAEWATVIDEHQVEFVGKNAEGVELVRGLVVVKAAVENGAIAVHADVTVLDDGDIPF
jgi:TusA-related sulfurtransferase